MSDDRDKVESLSIFCSSLIRQFFYSPSSFLYFQLTVKIYHRLNPIVAITINTRNEMQLIKAANNYCNLTGNEMVTGIVALVAWLRLHGMQV